MRKCHYSSPQRPFILFSSLSFVGSFSLWHPGQARPDWQLGKVPILALHRNLLSDLEVRFSGYIGSSDCDWSEDKTGALSIIHLLCLYSRQ